MPHFIKLNENRGARGWLFIYFFCKTLNPIKGRSSGYALKFGGSSNGLAVVVKLYHSSFGFGRIATRNKSSELEIALLAFKPLLAFGMS